MGLSDYAVRTDFLGQDRISSVYDQMGRAADRYGERAQSAMNGAARSADHAGQALRNATKHGYNFGAIVKGILAANAIRGGIGYIANGIQGTVRQFLDLDDVAVAAAAKFDDMGYASKNFGKNLDTVKSQMRSWAAGTRYTVTEVANAVHSFSEAGWSDNVVKGLMPYMMKAATANRVTDLTGMIEDLSSSFRSFGLDTGSPEERSKKFIRFTDQMTKGALDAAGGIDSLKEAMKNIAPTWKGSNDPADAIAYAVQLLNAGYQPDIIGTAGRNAALRIASDPRVKAEFDAAGIPLEYPKGHPKAGQLRTYLELFEDLKKRMDKIGVKFGSSKDIAINRMMFGAWSVSSNKTMLDNLAGWRQEIGRINTESTGIAGHVSDTIKQYSTMDKALSLLSTSAEKAFSVLEAFNKKGQTGIEGLTDAIRTFDTRPMIDALTGTYNALAPIGKFIAANAGILPSLVQAWVAWNGAMKVSQLVDYIAIAGGLTAVSTPLAAIVASLGALEAYKSLTTGQDNWISQLAQSLWIVPKLAHDDQGNVTGLDSNQSAPWFVGPDGRFNWQDRAERDAANAFRPTPPARFQGQLTIAGAPKGSTLEQSATSPAGFNAVLLGPQQSGVWR